MTQKALRRGIFLSVSDLQEAIRSFLAAWNANPKPFVWTAKLEDILEKIARARTKLESIQPGSTFPVAVKNARNEYAPLYRGHYTSLSLASLYAQAAAKPDSSAAVLHLEKARSLVGTQWTSAYQFFCVNPHANSNDDSAIEPSKIFDNVYVIGNTGTVAYAITTSEGIILLDSMAANQLDTVLLPGLRKLGLDPDQVKLVVVAHGHGDHFGGSVYFQKHGAHVAMSATDWDFIAPKADAPARGPAPPSRDIVPVEGQSVGLGEVRILPVLTPGHTPGSMAFIFPVKDNGKIYTAGMFGGTMLTATRPTPEEINQYLTSVMHFRIEALKAGVEVELQNHPLMDDLTGRLAQLRARGANGTNQFIVGRENYPLFLDVLSECMLAQVGRRAQSPRASVS